MAFMYSNCIGTFVFNDNNEVADKLMFPDIVDANIKLAANEWLSEERAIIKKNTGKLFFLGFKSEKIDGVVLTTDIKKLAVVSAKLKQYDAKINDAIKKLSKAAVKSSVESDELITQAVSSIQELDKAISMLTKRLREWYGLRNPELAATVSDNVRFVNELLTDTKTSEMGAKLSQDDEAEIKEAAKSVLELLKLRERQEKYLEKRMGETCPNIRAVSGPSIGAKLLSSAGSLRKLAVMPASTLQLLGAEKSMFKFLRKRSKKMPRFGILHEHKFIASAPEKEKGKAARLLADKISIAARVDYFKGEFVGDKLLKDIEGKL